MLKSQDQKEKLGAGALQNAGVNTETDLLPFAIQTSKAPLRQRPALIDSLLQSCGRLASKGDLATEVAILHALYLVLPAALEVHNTGFRNELDAVFLRIMRRLQFVDGPLENKLKTSSRNGQVLIKIVAYFAPPEHLVAFCTLYQIANQDFTNNPHELRLEKFIDQSPLYTMLISHANDLLGYYCRRKLMQQDEANIDILPRSWSPFVVAAQNNNVVGFGVVQGMLSHQQYCQMLRAVPGRYTNQCADICSILSATNNSDIIELAVMPLIFDMKATLQHPIAAPLLRMLLIKQQLPVVRKFVAAARLADLDALQAVLATNGLAYYVYRNADEDIISNLVHLIGFAEEYEPTFLFFPFLNSTHSQALRFNPNDIDPAAINRMKKSLRAWELMYEVVEKVTRQLPYSDDASILKENLIALFEWRAGISNLTVLSADEIAKKNDECLQSLAKLRNLSDADYKTFVQAFVDICKHGEFFNRRFQEFIIFLENRCVAKKSFLLEDLLDRLQGLDLESRFVWTYTTNMESLNSKSNSMELRAFVRKDKY